MQKFRAGMAGAILFILILLMAMAATVVQQRHPAGQNQIEQKNVAIAPSATATATPMRVAAVGTPFPTNIAHAPPTATATVAPSPTATPVILADTLAPTATQPPATAVSAAERAARYILVNQDEQRMHIFENGREIRTMPISTGKPVTNAFTPAWSGTVGQDWGSGIFRGTDLYSDYMWFLFPGPEGSILIHSVPYQKKGDEKAYDRLDALGIEPVSKGCVRISPEDAAWLKLWNPVGVSIEISRWSGKISTPEN